MNVSVPGGCHFPEPPKKSLIERLKDIFKSAVLLANDVRVIWNVIEFMKNPKDTKIERKVSGELKEIAEGRGLEFHHKKTLYDASKHIEDKANEGE